MAEYTTNYNLEKQQENEYININGINGNFDAIDLEVKKVNDTKSDKNHRHVKADIADFPDIPSSLPANGGNSDTVDGKHASDFAAVTHTHTRLPSNLIISREGGAEGGQFHLEIPSEGTNLSGDVLIDVCGNSLRFFEGGGSARGAYINITECIPGASSKIWNSSNDGSGSGLDADVLDGHHEHEFVRTEWHSSGIDVADPNYRSPYMVSVYGNASMPDADWWHVIYVPHVHANGYGSQIAIGYHGNPRTLIRTASGTAWGSWREITPTYSQTDLVASSSPLAEGSLYYVYE